MQPGQPPADGVLQWSLSYVADWSSVAGLALAVIGFGVTIWGVLRSKSAAERAAKAAEAARSNLLRVDSIAEVSGVITGLQDIKRLHRSGSWPSMPERYGNARRMLVAVRAGNPALTDPQKALLQSTIQQLSMMERQIEEHLARPADAPDVAKLNRLVSLQVDNLTQLLTELKINGERQ